MQWRYDTLIEQSVSDIMKEIAESNPPIALENQQISNTEAEGESE
jgi:hypothetical protein